MKTSRHKYNNLHNVMVDAMRRAEPLRAFLVLSLLLLLTGSMSAQSADCNYIRVVEPLARSVAEPSTDAELSRVGITYFDGLGREVQQVAVGQGGDGEDIVTLTEYDRYGNAYRDWLATPNQGNGAFVPPAEFATKAISFHGDQYPFTTTEYEETQLNRPMQQIAPGSDYHPHKRYRSYNYYTGGAVTMFKVGADGTTLRNAGVFGAGTLDCVSVTDEDGHETSTYTDRQGRTVLTRRHLSEGKTIDTYRVYDNYNHWGDAAIPTDTDYPVNRSLSAQGLMTGTAVLENGVCMVSAIYYDHAGRVVQRSERDWFTNSHGYSVFTDYDFRGLVERDKSVSQLYAEGTVTESHSRERRYRYGNSDSPTSIEMRLDGGAWRQIAAYEYDGLDRAHALTLGEDGTLLQDANYYPGGLSFSQLSDTEETDRLHCGKELVDMEGLGWYDNTARFHDAILCRFTTPDPLAEQYPDLSPYSHCANNPLTIVDPDGRVLRDADGNIVYNTNKTEETWKFNYEKEDGSNGTINVKVEIGYIYANDGTPIQVLHNNTSSDARWDTNCHGVTFADEKYWLNTDVTKLIELEYTEIPISEVQKGDVVVYDVDNMPACHSATVHEVVAPDENMIDVYSQNSYEIDSTVKELFIDKRGTDSYRFFRGTGDRRITEEEINQLPIPK